MYGEQEIALLFFVAWRGLHQMIEWSKSMQSAKSNQTHNAFIKQIYGVRAVSFLLLSLLLHLLQYLLQEKSKI